MTEKLKQPSKQRVLCKECQQITHHKVLYLTRRSEYNDEADIGVFNTYHILECLGCENVCFLNEYQCTEDIDPRTGQPDSQSYVYPSPHKQNRIPIDRIYHVPKEVRVAYEEVVVAINIDLILLTAMGVRLTIESICINQNIDGDNLKKKIDAMKKAGIVSIPDAKLLHIIRKIGNESAHKLKKQKEEALSLSIDIIEGILRQLYIHPKEASYLSD